MIQQRCQHCKVYGCIHMRSKGKDAKLLTIKEVTEPMIKEKESTDIVISATENSSFADDYIGCEICKCNVSIKYLDNHMKTHIYTTENKSASSSGALSSRSRIYSPAIIPTITPKVNPLLPKLKTKETYNYIPIDAACAISSTTQDQRYSDITIIFWQAEKPSISNTSYAGGYKSSTTSSCMRFQIHIVYDSKNQYWIVSSKLLKRSEYSNTDSEEGVVPDVVCCHPSEIIKAIKRSLLWFRMSPRAAYKQFRKLFNKEIVLEKEENSGASIAQTKNCDVLFERLKKKTTSCNGYAGYYGGEYGYNVD